jgi:hypothetical protein
LARQLKIFRDILFAVYIIGVKAFDQRSTLLGFKLDSFSHFYLVNIFLRLLISELRFDSLRPLKIRLMFLLNVVKFFD